MGLFAAEALERARSGRVLAVFCEDVGLAQSQLRAATEELDSVPTLVALDWQQAPSLARELEEIRDALAKAAASLWPDWYITAERRFERKRPVDLNVAALAAEATQSCPGVSTGWLREAWRRCRAGTLPIVDNMPTADQVRQLSGALDPTRLIFSLSVASAEASPARIRGLARAAEWLAHEAHAKTLLLVPASWHGHPELDHVSYGAVTLQVDDVVPQTSPFDRTTGNGQAPATNGSLPLSRSNNLLPKVMVGPIFGRPHPGSEAEQLVCEHLSADAELRGLFEFNQRLLGFGDTPYTVDLVWRQGGLVVELDGPEHRGHRAYVRDRDRDYRLCVSGYTTLRIPNDEVFANVNAVLQKIKHVVGFLKSRDRKERNQ